MNASIHNQSGFSLIEVLIALAILSTGLLAYSSAQIIGLRCNQDAYLQSLAQWQQNNLIEQLKLCQLVTDPTYCKQNAIEHWRASNSGLFPQNESSVKEDGSDFHIRIRWHSMLSTKDQPTSAYRSASLYARL